METLERLLGEHPFLEGLDPAWIAFLTGCARNVRFRKGELLLREGEEADASYLIRDGRVGLEVDVPARGSTVIQTVEAGEVVGWSWLFPPYRWHADARAMTDTRAFRLDGACLRAKCEAEPAFGFEIAKRLLRQLHARLERTRVQLIDVYESNP